MDLTNIALGLAIDKYASYYNGKYYQIPVITNTATLQTELDTATGFVVAAAVVQYKDNLSVPRIVCTDGNEDPDLEQTAVLPLDEISQDLSDALDITRAEVEAEITAQLP